ncbi:MAG: ATP-binding protein [Deltaproteobacteria bacterium]|nr:ATP-binding protein [Deltaproteobacteria bacterium]
MGIQEILALNERAKADGKNYLKTRPLFHEIHSEAGKHFIGIVGPRGVGKTVILKQLANFKQDSFYVSADTIGNLNLFDLGRILSDDYKIKFLLVDEIHFSKTYAKDIKKIYDFIDIRIIFTSSVSLSLFESVYDLSRRIALRFLYPFSFKEYLFFKKEIEIPALTIKDILDARWTSDHMRFDYLFDDYLQGGLFPFALEEPDSLQILKNICNKVVQRDIPMVSNLRFDDIEKIEKTLAFIGKSEVDGINFSSISRNLGITKYKAESYVKLLTRAFILNPIYPAGTNVLKEPKVLMALPYRLLYRDFDQCIGAIREDFFAEMLKMKGYTFHYLKTKRGAKTPDFLVEYGDDRIVIEVGGKGKGREQFKGITIDKKIVLSHTPDTRSGRKPLSLLGYLKACAGKRTLSEIG